MELNKFLEDFFIYLKSKGLSIKTQEAYENDLSLYQIFCENFKKDPFNEESIFHFFSYCSGPKKQKSSTLQRKRSALLAFSNYLKDIKGFSLFNSEHLKAPKKESLLPSQFSFKEIKTMLKSFDLSKPLEHRNYILILFLFNTGLRLSELLSLKASQFYLSQKELLVKGKGSKERIIFLSDFVLKEYQKYYLRFKTIIDRNQYIFFNGQKKVLQGSGVQWILKQLQKRFLNDKNLQKNIHPHAFRHSFATSLLKEGADIRKVAELMGHSSLNTTQKYTRLSRDQLFKSYMETHPHAVKNNK